MKIYVFKGSKKLGTVEMKGFREAGWSVKRLASGGLQLEGNANKATLQALNRAGYWWESPKAHKRHHRPAVDGSCCDHHKRQVKNIPSAKPKANRNPSEDTMKKAAKTAKKKAESWYSNPDLTTPPRVLKRKLPNAFVEVGTIEAIEYRSDKYDGKSRLYRHEVTKKRKLLISADGTVMIVEPGFKITKRGIEG
jgi:hypothetical protein